MIFGRKEYTKGIIDDDDNERDVCLYEQEEKILIICNSKLLRNQIQIMYHIVVKRTKQWNQNIKVLYIKMMSVTADIVELVLIKER